MCVSLHAVSTAVRGGCQILWDWSHHCEPSRGCWKSSPGPLEEQLLLLPAEPSLQPLFRTESPLGDSSLPFPSVLCLGCILGNAARLEFFRP